MTVADGDSRVCAGMHSRRPQITNSHTAEMPPTARRMETLLTLNQTLQAPDIHTRPTLRRSAVGRGKLRASRRSLLQTSSTSRARPLALARSLLLESPNTLLTDTDIDACLRTQAALDACVLTPTSIAVSSYSPREHSSSVPRCTCTESDGTAPKPTRIKYQQAVLRNPANRDKHECSKYTTPSGSHPPYRESESGCTYL